MRINPLSRSFCVGLLLTVAMTPRLATADTTDDQVWALYQRTKDWPLESFNRALDLLDDSERKAVQSDFAKTNPADAELAVLSGSWSDQIAAAAVLVASARADGGTVHLGEGNVFIPAGAFGVRPTRDDAIDAYARTRPDGIRPAVHDPSPPLFENGHYYLFATAEGMPVFRSRDRIHWRNIGQAYPKNRQPKWWQDWQPAHVTEDPKTGTLLSGEYNPNVFLWAPHLFRYGGKYHLFYAIPASFGGLRTSAIGHASKATLDPAVPWHDEGRMISSGQGDRFNCIDPDFVLDRDGRPWMAFGSFNAGGINLVPLDTGTAQVKPGAHAPWTQIAGDGMESPAVIFDARSDRYYLFTSEGYGIGRPWDYKVRVYRTEPAAPVGGPYFDDAGRPALAARNQVGRGDRDNNPGRVLIGAQGDRVAPGGQALFTDDRDGKLNVVFHERDNAHWVTPAHGDGWPQFNLQIREVTFDPAGWPVLGPPTLPTPDPTTKQRPATAPGESH